MRDWERIEDLNLFDILVSFEQMKWKWGIEKMGGYKLWPEYKLLEPNSSEMGQTQILITKFKVTTKVYDWTGRMEGDRLSWEAPEILVIDDWIYYLHGW